MTNPDDAIGTNGAYNGRTSVNAFNDDLSVYSRGILSGWSCSPSSGLKVTIGGVAGVRDVAVAEDDNGNKTSINNISEEPIEVTIGAAPGANSRIDSIVLYVDNPPEGSTTKVDNYETCGMVVVAGTVSSTPTAPDDTAIRTAITGDGATGTTAYYVVVANILMANGTTDITSNLISSGGDASIKANNINFGTVSAYSSSTTSQSVTQTFADCLSVDISNIPVGATFVATFVGSFSGTDTLTGTLLRAYYNDVAGGEYRQTTTYSKSVYAQEIFTKVSGANTLKIQCRKDNTSTVSLTNRSCVCMIIG
jgi:hypothetical protein